MMIDTVDTFLKYGLLIGGVFQLICILAIIFVPCDKFMESEVQLGKQKEEHSAKSVPLKQKVQSSKTRKRR